MTGVRVFFVLSGYLITMLLRKELRKTDRIDWKRFYVKRAVRLMPAFYAYMIFMAFMTGFDLLPLHLKDFAFSLAYIMNYYPHGGPWAVGHFWSFSIQEQFYLLWPLAIVLGGEKRMPKVLIAAMIAAPLVRLTLLPWKMQMGTVYGTMFPSVCDAIAAGCLLAVICEQLHKKQWYMKFLSSSWYLVLIPATLCLELMLPESMKLVVGQSLLNIAITITVDGCATFDKSRIGVILNSRPLVAFGQMSYSIYLWQQPFLNHEQHASWTQFPMNIVLALSCAVASYYLLEKPFLTPQKKVAKPERGAVRPIQPSVVPEFGR